MCVCVGKDSRGIETSHFILPHPCPLTHLFPDVNVTPKTSTWSRIFKYVCWIDVKYQVMILGIYWLMIDKVTHI